MSLCAPGALPGRISSAAILAVTAIAVVGCEAAPSATPRITPGSEAAPRDVNVIAREYLFEPAVVDLVPGETVLLHVINAGLVVHEAVVGDMRVQDAWEAAEAAAANPPPGPTPVVSVPPNVAGLRVLVASGQRVDARWTVPDSAADGEPWFVGCHIPGHWQLGMVVPVRFVGRDGVPLATQ